MFNNTRTNWFPLTNHDRAYFSRNKRKGGPASLLKIFFVVFAAANALCGNAFAVTVSETTDFPGSSSFPGVSVGTLTPGANSISGSLSGTCAPGDCNGFGAGDTQDSFTFTVETGATLENLFVTTSNVSGPAGFSVTFALHVDDPVTGPTLVFDNIFYLPLNSTSENLYRFLDPGNYSASVFGQGADVAGTYSLDYSVGLNVSAVPVPAAVWLFGSGFLGLVGIARRKRRTA